MSSIIYKPDVYAKLNRIQRTSVFKQVIKHYELIASLVYPAKVLDVGCGTGENTKLFTFFNNVTEIDAFDFGPDMIEYAKEKNFETRIRYAVADAERRSTWPSTYATENRYDLATSFFVLHWIKGVDKVLENIRKSLKPGGYFLAKLAGSKRRADIDLSEFIANSQRWSKYSPNHRYVDHSWINVPDPAEKFSQLLIKVGFSNICCENIYLPDEYFYNKDEVKEYITWSRLRHYDVPEEEFDEFKEECTKAFLKSFVIKENGVCIRQPSLHMDVLARK